MCNVPAYGWGAAGAGPVLVNGWSTPVWKPWLQKPELYLTNKSVYEWSHGCVLFTMLLTYSTKIYLRRHKIWEHKPCCHCGFKKISK